MDVAQDRTYRIPYAGTDLRCRYDDDMSIPSLSRSPLAAPTSTTPRIYPGSVDGLREDRLL